MNQKKKKKEPGDISKEPEMIELERMIDAGELDGDRTAEYARNREGTSKNAEK